MERQIYKRLLKSEPSIVKLIENKSDLSKLSTLSETSIVKSSEHLSKLTLYYLKKRATRRSRRAREPSRIPLLFLRELSKKNSMLKKIVFKTISTTEIPKSSKLHRYVNKVRKLYHARYKCNNNRDRKIINLNKMAIPKKAYLLSFFSRHYHKIMKLKCKVRRYLSLFSCNCASHMTNYVNFKLSKDIEKNPGPTQYNTDHHEVIIRPSTQNHSSTMQLTSPISSENLMQSRLGELCLQSVDVGGAGDCFFRSVSHQLYGNSNHHMPVRTAGVQFMRDNPQRFTESNNENSWLRYLNNMCIQGTWADALIIQVFADALKVTIHSYFHLSRCSNILLEKPLRLRNCFKNY